MDCKVLNHKRLAKNKPSPHEVWLILGITASNAAGVDPFLSLLANGVATAFWQCKSCTILMPRGRQWCWGDADFRTENYNGYVVNSTWKFTNDFLQLTAALRSWLFMHAFYERKEKKQMLTAVTWAEGFVTRLFLLEPEVEPPSCYQGCVFFCSDEVQKNWGWLIWHDLMS